MALDKNRERRKKQRSTVVTKSSKESTDSAALRSAGPSPKQWLWVGLVASMLFLLGVATLDDGGLETDGERIARLSESFACPECRGQSVSESNAPVAVTIRQFIRNEVTIGSTDEEIRDQLVTSYSSKVLLNPPGEGFSSLIWILPVMVFVGGSAGVGWTVNRSRGGSRDATDADRKLVADAQAQSAKSGPGTRP